MQLKLMRSIKNTLITIHTSVANKIKISGQLPLEHFFQFGKTLKRITKQLGFDLAFKMADLKDNIYITLANDITVTINNLNFVCSITKTRLI